MIQQEPQRAASLKLLSSVAVLFVQPDHVPEKLVARMIALDEVDRDRFGDLAGPRRIAGSATALEPLAGFD
jgi:hypothetical protein